MSIGAFLVFGFLGYAFFLYLFPQKNIDEIVPPSVWGNIIVTEPVPYQEVGFPLVLTGQARVFESVFQYRLLDDAGNVLAQNYAMANALDVGLYGDFSLEIVYQEPKSVQGVLEVFSYSAKDGSEQDMVRIPVRFLTRVRE